MHMVAYEGLRPSVTRNCLPSLKKLIDQCVSDDDSSRPTFEDIITEFEHNIRPEAFQRQVCCVCVCVRVCVCVCVPVRVGVYSER